MLRTLVLLSISVAINANAADSWPQWRGSGQDGIAPAGDYPVSWSSESNVVWRRDLDGKGGSTPIIVDGNIYLTGGDSGQNQLLCLGSDGKTKWQASVGADRGGKHKKGSGSNPSPVSDGSHIYCYYRSGDVGCLDLAGKVVWQGNLQEKFGEDTLWWDLGTSPVLTDDAVVVAVMQSGPSYLVALDKTSGDVLWKTDRSLDAPEEAAQSYSTPQVVTVNDKQAIATLGADHVTLHDAATGQELGRLGGFNPKNEKYWRSIASPTVEGDLIFCPYARGNTVTAVSLKALAAGGGENSIVWQRDDLGADVPTPVAHNGKLYVIHDKGRFQCVDSQTGKTLWSGNLPKHRMSYTSSPLLASGNLYFTREDATTFVVPIGKESFEIAATNELESNKPYTVASLVPFNGRLLLRTATDLICVANKD